MLSWDAARALRRLHARHGAAPFFRAALGADPTRPGALLLALRPGGLGLPDRSYYYAGPQSEVVKAYKRLMRDVVSLLGANSRDAGFFADDVFDYERRLASITPEKSELETTGPAVLTLGDLRVSTQSLPLQDILGALFPRARINDSTKILLPSPFFIKHLSVVISTTDRSVLNNYLMWTLVREYLPYMSNPYRHVLHEYTTHITGSSYQPPRWEFCTNLLYKFLPLATNAIVENSTDKLINNDFRHRTLQNVFSAIKISTMNKIKRANWINSALERHLLQKIDVMTLEVELPPFTLQPSYLKEHYSSLMIQKHNMFRNIGFGFDFARERMQTIYLSSLKSEERLIPPEPDMISVSYYESRNAIIVPRLLANPPYYHPNYPMYPHFCVCEIHLPSMTLSSIQFGRLGIQIATVLARAILLPEPLAAPVGRVDSRLSPIDDSIEKYSRLAINFSQYCLQNALIYKHGVNASVANITKLDTLVQLTGVRVALEAMEWRMGKDVHPTDQHEHIPGLDVYEDPAVFSLSYAQDQCDLDTKEKHLMENCVHLRLQKRILFQTVWSQMPKFQEYLGCRVTKGCAEIL